MRQIVAAVDQPVHEQAIAGVGQRHAQAKTSGHGHDGKEALKTFDSLDGHGIKLLQSIGVIVAIITGRSSGMVEGRAKELGIKYVQMGVANKFNALNMLLEQTKLSLKDCAAIGDRGVDLCRAVYSHSA